MTSETMTSAEYQATAPKGKSKYGAIRTEVDGIVFASKAEASRYVDLKRLQDAGEIGELVLQPRFDLIVNGVKICRYIGDFEYFEGEVQVIEDCKGMKTPTYRLKKKLMKALLGIEIRETA